MFNIEITCSDDSQSAELKLPKMDSALQLNADEVSELIRHLAWLRASMLPPYDAKDLTPGTPTSGVPAVCYKITEDDLHDHFRLYVLHPGFGWLFIHLPKEAVTKIATDADMFLRASPSRQ